MHQQYRVTGRSRDGGVLTRRGADLGRAIAELKSTGHGEIVKIECREVTAWRDVPVASLEPAPAMGSGG